MLQLQLADIRHVINYNYNEFVSWSVNQFIYLL